MKFVWLLLVFVFLSACTIHTPLDGRGLFPEKTGPWTGCYTIHEPNKPSITKCLPQR